MLSFVGNKLIIFVIIQIVLGKKRRKFGKKIDDFEINVSNGVKGILYNFQSFYSNNPKVSKPLKTSKNGKGIEFLSRIFQENKKEKFHNSPKKFKPLGMA